jgi:hypothetical protein
MLPDAYFVTVAQHMARVLEAFGMEYQMELHTRFPQGSSQSPSTTPASTVVSVRPSCTAPKWHSAMSSWLHVGPTRDFDQQYLEQAAQAL